MKLVLFTVVSAFMLRSQQQIMGPKDEGGHGGSEGSGDDHTTTESSTGFFNGTVLDPEYWEGDEGDEGEGGADGSGDMEMDMHDPCMEPCDACMAHYDDPATMEAFDSCIAPAWEEGGACSGEDHDACHEAHMACDSCDGCGCDECAMCHEEMMAEEHHIEDHDDPCYDMCGECHDCHEDGSVWEEAEACAAEHPDAAACDACDACWHDGGEDCEATCEPCWESTMWDDCMPCQGECTSCDTCWRDVHASDLAEMIKEHLPAGCEDTCHPCADCMGHEYAHNNAGEDAHEQCEAKMHEDEAWQQGCEDCDNCDWDSCDWESGEPCECETLCHDSCWGKWDECHHDQLPEACAADCTACGECAAEMEEMGMPAALVHLAKSDRKQKGKALGHLKHKSHKHAHHHKASQSKSKQVKKSRGLRRSRHHKAFQILSHAKKAELVKRFAALKKMTTKRSKGALLKKVASKGKGPRGR